MAFRPFSGSRRGLFGRRRGMFRRLGWLSLASALWNNRRDVQRWARFVQRAVQERDRRPMSDVMTEARVRAAVSRDPLLRRDDALEDLRVDDGVVTMLTSTASWPDPRDQMVKLKQVKGITDVTAKPAPPTPDRSPRSTFARMTGASAARASNAPSSVTYVADAPIAATPGFAASGSSAGGR